MERNVKRKHEERKKSRTISGKRRCKSRLVTRGSRPVESDQDVQMGQETRDRWEHAIVENGKTGGRESGGRTTSPFDLRLMYP